MAFADPKFRRHNAIFVERLKEIAEEDSSYPMFMINLEREVFNYKGWRMSLNQNYYLNGKERELILMALEGRTNREMEEETGVKDRARYNFFSDIRLFNYWRIQSDNKLHKKYGTFLIRPEIDYLVDIEEHPDLKKLASEFDMAPETVRKYLIRRGSHKKWKRNRRKKG